MLYVVEHGQSAHFSNLFQILNTVSKNPEKNCTLKHVQFGRIKGMSTRKGTAVFLSDILDEAKDRMAENMRKSDTTKVTDENDFEQVAETLGISAVIVNDLKEKKGKNYEFSWDSALKTKGSESGIRLQYAHSRLCNILKANAELEIWAADLDTLDWNSLQEPEALQLILKLAQFEEHFAQCYTNLEPCILVKYLFELTNDCGKAIKVLKVKDTPKEQAVPRFVLFQVTQNILHFSMKILGLRPLEKM